LHVFRKAEKRISSKTRLLESSVPTILKYIFVALR